MRTRITLLDSTAFLFVLLWAYTAFNKLREFDETVLQLSQSPIVGKLALFFAIALPIIEFSLVVLLLMDRTKKIGLYLSLALITAFTTYIIILLNFSYHVPCACGGILSRGITWNGELIFKMTWEKHIAFNLFFLCLGILNILLPKRKEQPEKIMVTNLEIA